MVYFLAERGNRAEQAVILAQRNIDHRACTAALDQSPARRSDHRFGRNILDLDKALTANEALVRAPRFGRERFVGQVSCKCWRHPTQSHRITTLDGDDCQAVADAMNEAAGQNWIGAVVPTSVVRRTAETHRAGRYRSFV